MFDMELSPDTVLQLTPGIRTRWNAAGHVVVDSPVGTIIDIGPRGFGILSMFSQPTRLGDAIDRLEHEHHPSTDLAPTLSVLNMLIEESALVSSDGGRARTSGWADPVEHARMLHDERRTGDYLAALAAAVRPDDVVLDIGTGSGVLAVAAARAGARHVYAVEASDIAEVAERVFAVNGVRDRVTLLPGWSRQIELPAAGRGPRAAPRSRGTRPARRRSRSCSAGAPRRTSRSSRCGCCPPTTSTGPTTSCCRCSASSRTRCGTWPGTAAGASTTSASSTCCPDRTQQVLKKAEQQAGEIDGILVNVAVGYGGRQEITDAVRSLLADRAAAGATLDELAEDLTVEDISEHLYTRGQPDPDLVIRTSGEQRLSGFMLWQSAHSEYYFCEVFWPAFRKVDFLRALRDYAARHRRYGN